MKLEIAGIVAGALLIWGKITKWLDNASKFIQPIIEDIEEKSKDSKLTSEEKRDIARNAVRILEEQGKWKLNFITRRIIFYYIDKLARKLPDSGVNFNELVTKAKEDIR